ncbi:MAG: hypothetical protein ACP5IE_01615 [Infirmifilum sp.]
MVRIEKNKLLRLGLLALAGLSALFHDTFNVYFLWSLSLIFLVILVSMTLLEAVSNVIGKKRAPAEEAPEESYEGLLEETRRRLRRGETVKSEELERRIFYFATK